MTREEFIEVLDLDGYSYEIEGDKIVVTGGDERGDVWLELLNTLPPGVEFRNEGEVDLASLKTLPRGVKFKNRLGVWLESLETISPGVEFKNGSGVVLHSLKTLPPSVEFKNGGYVNLEKLIGGKFHNWTGNIEDVDSKMLLNSMISKGMFI